MEAPPLLAPIEESEDLAGYKRRITLLNGASRTTPLWPVLRQLNRTVDWGVPFGVRDFTESVGALLGNSDPMHWLGQHTTVPFWCATLTPEKRERYVGGLLAGMRGPRKPVLAISLADWLLTQPVLCPHCDDENVRTVGFSFVPRTFLLPFLTRCDVHGERLSTFPNWTPRWRGAAQNILALPSRKKAGEALSARGALLLEGQEDLYSRLGALCSSRGYTTKTGRIRGREVAELLTRFSKGRQEHPELDRILTTPEKVARLIAPLNNPRANLHPFIADQLVQALEGEPETQRQLFAASSKSGARQQAISQALLVSSNMTEVARLAGVTVTTASVAAAAAGLPVLRRPKVLKPPLRNKAEALLASSSSVALVAKKLGLSLSSVYRILKTAPALKEERDHVKARKGVEAARREWLLKAKETPGFSTTELRSQAPSTYTYLYRHDRLWLSQNSPKAPRKPLSKVRTSRVPEGVDQAVAKRVNQISEQHSGPSGAPMQTRSLLASLAGRGEKKVNRRSTPLTYAALQECCESPKAYVVRRLEQAIADLWANDEGAVAWAVVRRARLRPSTVEASGVSVEAVIRKARARLLEERRHVA